MSMKKKFMFVLFSVLIIAFSLGFSQATIKAADAKPIGWTYTSGTWYYLDANGVKLTNKWEQDKSLNWFYLKEDGAMATNKWAQDGSKRWFYLGTEGAMATNKWAQDNSKKWFYLGTDGAMQVNTWAQDGSKRWFFLSSDGSMKTSSWISYNSNWYYVNADGAKAVSTITPDGYIVDADGIWGGKTAVTKDTSPPVITLKGGSPLTISGAAGYTDPGVTITDNIDATLKPTITYTDSLGRYLTNIDLTKATTYTITYNAMDSAGNKAVPVVRTVVVTNPVVTPPPVVSVDTTAPVITLKGYSTLSIKNGLIYSDAGATVTDSVDTALIPTKIITDAAGNILTKIDTTKAGTYKVTYNAVDSAGNKAIPVIRTVVVKEVNAPIKFAIDMGHNAAYDSGAVGIRREDDCTREVANLVMQKLTALKYDVVNTLPTNATSTRDSLQQRCDNANAAGADYYVSIHFNVFNGVAQGTEVYYYDGNEIGKIRASNVLSEITSLGYTDRGVKATSTLYVLKNTDMPAILIECAFLDSTADMDRYNPEAMASAIVKGLTK